MWSNDKNKSKYKYKYDQNNRSIPIDCNKPNRVCILLFVPVEFVLNMTVVVVLVVEGSFSPDICLTTDS